MGLLTKSLHLAGFEVIHGETPDLFPQRHEWPMSDDQLGFFCSEERFGAKPGSPPHPRSLYCSFILM